MHASHYPGAYTEAALTSVGAWALSVLVAATPVGKRIDALAERVFHHHSRVPSTLAASMAAYTEDVS